MPTDALPAAAPIPASPAVADRLADRRDNAWQESRRQSASRTSDSVAWSSDRLAVLRLLRCFSRLVRVRKAVVC